MLAKLRAQEIQAFARYKSADGTEGVTALTAGIQFKNGLYVGGTFSAAALPITTNNITINGTAGNGYIQYAAQTVAPSLALVHTFANSSGHFAIGQSGSSGKTISFTDGLMTSDRDYAFQDKSGTLAMTGDNISTFVNDSGYVVGPASAVSGRLPSFNGTTGKLVQDSGILTTDLVLKTRTLTEGAGLAGNTYDLSANRTLAMGTPSTLTVATTNTASGTTHSHAITSSANPGAAAAILATDSSGFLRLVRLGIGTAPSQPLHVAGNAFIDAATANLYMKDTSTGLQVSATGIISPQSGNAWRNTAYTSGVSGWNQSNNGDAEFNNVRIRGEIAASVFKVSEISATAGTLGVFYSATTLAANGGGQITTPGSVGSNVVIECKNSDAGVSLLAVNDVIRLKSWTGSGISDAWLTVLVVNANHGATTQYTARLEFGSTSATFSDGTAVVDYGPSGTGFITLSTDGTVGSSPNMTMATHAGSPWSAFTTLSRLGNLNGSYGYATAVYGLGMGQYGTASKSWVTIDQTNGFRVGNNTTVLGQWDVSGNATFGQVAASKANVFWNASNSRLEFRGNTTVQSYIDTDGSFTAGGGNTVINAAGLSLAISSSSTVNGDAGTAITWGARGVIFSDDNSEIHIQATGGSAFFPASKVSVIASEYGGANGAIIQAVRSGGASYALVYGGGATLTGMTIGSNAVPTHMLDVYGDGWFSGNGATLTTVDSRTTGSPFSRVILKTGNREWQLTNDGGFSNAFYIQDTTAGALRLVISTAGALRLNAYGAGTLVTDASGNVTASSDERLKTGIRKFRKGLDAIKRLEPIMYRWNKKSGLDAKTNYVGFGAGHTKKHLPEAVGKGKDGFLTMNDRAILAAVVNSIKELEDKYESLSRTIAA